MKIKMGILCGLAGITMTLVMAPAPALAQGGSAMGSASGDPLSLTAAQQKKMTEINAKYFVQLQAVRKKYKPQADVVRAKHAPLFVALRAKNLKPEIYTAEMIKLQAKMQAEVGPVTKKIQLEQKPIEDKKNQEILTILDAKQKVMFKAQIAGKK